MHDRRESGILLHVTSLPSEYGIGDLGPWACRFVDFLAAGGQRLWQVLPLNPTDLAFGDSPYSSPSALAANPLLLSPEILLEQGLVQRSDLDPLRGLPHGTVDYGAVTAAKRRLFEAAYERFAKAKYRTAFERFAAENADWLEDYALFVALREQFQKKPWQEWPAELRDRNPEALKAAREKLHKRVELEKFLQVLVHEQWSSLRAYCGQKNIRILGDLPIYVSGDSADIWTHAELFNLDEEKQPVTVAGVPPDYFSKTGQLWGNPVYRWDVLKQSGYAWWLRRLERNFSLFDFVRIDHFRGFAGYWEVPAGEATAVKGKWTRGPGDDFFHAALQRFPAERFVAEDLGAITDDVRALIARLRLPGMRVLQFAFGDGLARNPFAPHNHVENCVVYTGTHDNNTTRGWYDSETSPEDRRRINLYLGKAVGPADIPWDLVRLAMTSVAKTVIFPMQDILGLGPEARMNHPASSQGNWRWRLTPEQLNPETSKALFELASLVGRT